MKLRKTFTVKGRGVAAVMTPDGQVRHDLPDGTTEYITLERWKEITAAAFGDQEKNGSQQK